MFLYSVDYEVDINYGFIKLFACKLLVQYSTPWREGHGHETDLQGGSAWRVVIFDEYFLL